MAAADDEDWEGGTPPMTAVAVRLEVDAVAAVRDRAAAEGITPSTLMRRWILERLETEASADASA